MIKFMNSKSTTVKVEQIKELYKQESWWPDRNDEDIEKYILKSEYTYFAMDHSKLVGMCRVVNDGKFRGYIEDFVIRENYQDMNIGTELLKFVLEENGNINLITLFCSKKIKDFYNKSGFTETKQIVLHRDSIK